MQAMKKTKSESNLVDWLLLILVVLAVLYVPAYGAVLWRAVKNFVLDSAEYVGYKR